MHKLLRYKLFESVSINDLKFSEETLSKLKKLTEEGFIDEYWVELGDDVDFSDEDNPKEMKNVPRLFISLDQQTRIFTEEKEFLNFLRFVEENHFPVDYETIQTIPEFLKLIGDEGWNIIHTGEKFGSYVLTKNPYILGLSFYNHDSDHVRVRLKSHKFRGGKGYELEEIVKNGEHLRKMRSFIREFLKHKDNLEELYY